VGRREQWLFSVVIAVVGDVSCMHVSAAQVLNPHQREKLLRLGGGFRSTMSKLFTRLLVMCAYCGQCTWDPVGGGQRWELVMPEGGWCAAWHAGQRQV
jgi:hypothetical protein